MKKLAFFAVMIITGFMGFAQVNQTRPITFGIRAGVDFQNFNGQDFTGNDLDMSLAVKYNAGVILEFNVAPEFFAQTGLLYTTKGASSDVSFMDLDASVDYNLAYIELPINLLYKPMLGNGYFLLGFGPYVGYGIGGKYEYTVGGVTVEQDIEFTNEYDGSWEPGHFKSLDFGGNLFFGYEFFNGFSAQLNTQLGLMNIKSENAQANEENFRNTGYGVSLGYKF